ncbi:MAG: hypothetical protein J6I40_05710 [Mailhella sp.]|nr:hypothetical protein [Mailhella sp.]
MISVYEYVPLKGFEGTYEVNRLGDIKRVGKEKSMKQRVADGYKVVTLSVGGKARQYRVQTLVGRTFLRPLKKGECYFHKNGDKLDNWVNNLEIRTMRDVYRDIGKSGTRARPVEQIDESGKVIDSFKSAKAASEELFLSLPQVLLRLNRKMKRKIPPFLRWAQGVK